MGPNRPVDQPLIREWKTSKEEFLPDGKEDQTYIFREILDDQGLPKVFSLKTQEVKMFLRVVQFFTGRIIWERDFQSIGALETLLGLQFLEWFENLPVSSNLLSKELHMIYTIWNSIFDERWHLLDSFSYHKKRKEIQKIVSRAPNEFGHLTLRHYQSECRRDTFLNYIRGHLVSQREIQRRNLNKQSHFKRSSDHSNSTRGNTSFGWIPKPRIRDVSPQELKEFLELTPKERKHKLLE